MGKHIYLDNSSFDSTISVPWHYDNQLPIGFTVVIVNNSSNTVLIAGDTNGWSGVAIVVPGVDEGNYWVLDDPGMATLIKVDKDIWFMTGNVTVTGP
jgi:hypothetical protein